MTNKQPSFIQRVLRDTLREILEDPKSWKNVTDAEIESGQHFVLPKPTHETSEKLQ